MKFRNLLLTSVLAAVPSLAFAQPVTGPYVSLGAGADFLQNQPLKLAPQFPSRDKTYKFDPGFAGEISGGWGFGNGLRAEIEGNFSDNQVRGVGSAAPERAGGRELQYGGFVNALYDFDLGLPVFPYLGVGAGGQVLEANNLNSGAPGVASRSSDQSVSSFAYQAIAGVSYPLPWVAGLSVTAEYRFIGLLDPLPAVQRTAVSSSGAVLATGNGKLSNDFNHQVMFGLRYAFGTPPAAPPPASIPVAAPAPSPARTYLVFFDWDRANLTDRARQIIADAAAASTHVAYTRIEVDGYTDLSGTAQYNQGLSVRRANAVAGELVRLGVPQTAINIQGFGESHPLVPTAQGVREPQNRRVEIVIK